MFSKKNKFALLFTLSLITLSLIFNSCKRDFYVEKDKNPFFNYSGKNIELLKLVTDLERLNDTIKFTGNFSSQPIWESAKKLSPFIKEEKNSYVVPLRNSDNKISSFMYIRSTNVTTVPLLIDGKAELTPTDVGTLFKITNCFKMFAQMETIDKKIVTDINSKMAAILPAANANKLSPTRLQTSKAPVRLSTSAETPAFCILNLKGTYSASTYCGDEETLLDFQNTLLNYLTMRIAGNDQVYGVSFTPGVGFNFMGNSDFLLNNQSYFYQILQDFQSNPGVSCIFPNTFHFVDINLTTNCGTGTGNNGNSGNGGQRELDTQDIKSKFPCFEKLILQPIFSSADMSSFVSAFMTPQRPTLTYTTATLDWNNNGFYKLGETENDTTGAGLSSKITFNDQMILNSSPLLGAATVVHETFHGYINYRKAMDNYNVISQNESWMESLTSFYMINQLPANYSNHSIMLTSYFNQAVNVLRTWDQEQTQHHTDKELAMAMLYGLNTFESSTTQTMINYINTAFSDIMISYGITFSDLNTFYSTQLSSIIKIPNTCN